MKKIKGKTLKEFMKQNSKTAEIYYLDKMPADKKLATQMMNKSGKTIIIHEEDKM